MVSDFMPKGPENPIKIIKFERPRDVTFDDRTFDLKTCTCDASKTAHNVDMYVPDDLSELKSLLQVPGKWSFLQQSELKSEIQGIAQITKTVPKCRSGIQLIDEMNLLLVTVI